MKQLCPLCGGLGKLALYDGNDEQLEHCPLCCRSPWDMARGTGKTIITPIMGPMIGVYYPHRKTGDVYVILEGQPVHCCQCEANFPVDQFSEHIDSHDSRKKRRTL